MRIYYTSDLHGSEKCWRKFLVTPKYYQVDVIIIGGDITGKFIVPIIQLPKGRAEATFMGRKRKLKKTKRYRNTQAANRHEKQEDHLTCPPKKTRRISRDPRRVVTLIAIGE